jgi:preprotein translocase subunit Sss1
MRKTTLEYLSIAAVALLGTLLIGAVGVFAG